MKRMLAIFCSVVLAVPVMLFFHLQSAPRTAHAASSWDTYSDTWVGVDDLGRSLPTYSDVGAPRQKYVGMFYEVWHTEIGASTSGIYDVSNILAHNPGAITNPNSPPWGPYNQTHYWGQPMMGYYSNDDEYVLHKHAQMLSDAGVDTIVIDLSNYSNGNAYFKAQWLHLMSVWESIRQSGGKTPQVMFLVPFFDQGQTAACVNSLYQDLYAKGLYQDLWFQWDSKPLVLANPAWITDSAQASFFTFRINQAGYGAGSQNAWGWLSTYPQTPFYTSANPSEEVTVSPAQNASVAGAGPIAMSSRDANGNFIARGKSFHNGAEPASTNPLDPAYPSAQGYNFTEEWNRALSLDPSFALVSNFDEWIMGRYTNWNGDSGPNAFVDEFDPEFSRDLEPMVGGYKDDFYNHLVANIRKFKGVRPLPAPSAATTIAVDGNFGDWSNVGPEYRDDTGDTVHRNSPGFGGYTTYTDSSGRNDFVLSKVARDANNIYFYVKTAANITPHTDPNWMQLFIRTNTSQANWEGYNYVLNRSGVNASTTTLEKSTGGWNWSAVDSNIQYSVNGQEMEIAIPRSDLGFGNTGVPIQFDFKWADNINPNSDSSEFYLHGDAAPNERFAYRFSEVPQAPAPVKLSNFGFEVPSIGSGYQYGPMTAGWTFDAHAGVQGNGSPFHASSAPEGTQTAFVQGAGTMTQTVTFPGGNYVVNFQAARRTDFGGQQSFDVYIDSNKVGSFSPTTGSFSSFATGSFSASAGDHTVKFVGTNTNGDNTDFIDAVTITPASGNGSGNGINLAAGKPVTVSSTVNSDWSGGHLTDGNTTSAWSSQNTGGSAANEWAYINLGSQVSFDRVTLFPRTEQGAVYCFPQSFKIQGSNDANNWTDLLSETNYPAPATGDSGVTLNTGAQRYQYVRILVSQARPDNFNNYYVQLGEMEVYNNALSTGAQATVSSTVNGDWPASRLTDGDPTSAWSSQNTGGSAANEWAYVNLGGPVTFDRVTLFPRVGGGNVYCFPQSFKIQGSNDANNWTDLLSETNYPSPPNGESGVALNTGTQTYQYVRVLVSQTRTDNANNYYVQLGELEVDR